MLGHLIGAIGGLLWATVICSSVWRGTACL